MLVSPVLLALSLLAQSSTATQPPTQPPDLTLPPETASTVTILEGRGVQIYTCTPTAGAFQWTLKAPEAGLFNLATGKQVGHHDAGPIWTLDDGSAVRGTALARKAADLPTDVPWLLLKAEPATSTQGTLSPVTYVRRYNTHGGIAPVTGCDAAHGNTTLRVPYTASYAFYATPGAPSNTQTAPATPAPSPR